MTALEVLNNLMLTDLVQNDLKYCLVDKKKIPHKLDGSLARPNCDEDFVDIFELTNAENLAEYAGLGISIKASNITAIDVDHCFSEPFVFETIDERGKDIFEMFKSFSYIEFSFSGTGMRVLFRCDNIDEYSKTYFVKNSKQNIEFYQPSGNARYVTITGKYLANNSIQNKIHISEVLFSFLNKYMIRPIKPINECAIHNSDKSIDELRNELKKHLFRNIPFQEKWFGKAPGSNKNESELDYAIISFIYTNITTDKEKIRILFESSPYFKSKDYKHKYKWEYNNHRYYDFIYSRL